MSLLRKIKTHIHDAKETVHDVTDSVKENVKENYRRSNIKSFIGSLRSPVKRKSAMEVEPEVIRRAPYSGFAFSYSTPAHAIMKFREQYSKPQKVTVRVPINRGGEHQRISIAITPPSPPMSGFGPGCLIAIGSDFHKLIMPDSSAVRNSLIIEASADLWNPVEFHVHPTIVRKRCPTIQALLNNVDETTPRARRFDEHGRRHSWGSEHPDTPVARLIFKEDPNYLLYALEFCYSGCYGVKNPRIEKAEDHARLGELAERLGMEEMEKMAWSSYGNMVLKEGMDKENQDENEKKLKKRSTFKRFSFMSSKSQNDE